MNKHHISMRMVHIYIDESGDLGMACRESRHFIITAVRINDERNNLLLKRIPKKVRQKLLKKKMKALPELKFSNTPDKVREKYLKMASEIDIGVYAIILDKAMISRTGKNDLVYRNLTKLVLDKALHGLGENASLIITLDKCMTARQREELRYGLRQELNHIFSKTANAEISHEDSKENSALQVIDFICGAFGYKYNTSKEGVNSNRYTSIICKRIKFEEKI